jgi:hypothetical protein
MDPPSTNAGAPGSAGASPAAPMDSALHALLSFNADLGFPSQAADVVNVADLVPLCTALQLRAEAHPAFRNAHVAPHANRLLPRLAFWLAAFPDSDNVVGVICILTYVVALCPGGCEAVLRAAMPAADEDDVGAAAAAAAASAGDERAVPRARLLLPRLLYAVTRTLGREAPSNALIAGARAGSLLAALAGVLGEVSSRWAAAPPPRPPPPPLLLRLRAALLHPAALATAARIVGAYGARPPAPDPLTGTVSAPAEAAGALQFVARAGAASDGALGALCASSLAVARACGVALRTSALTPAHAAALAEVARNALCFFPAQFDALAGASRACGGGMRGWAGVEGAFFAAGFGGEEGGSGAGGGGGGAPEGAAAPLRALGGALMGAAEVLTLLVGEGSWLDAPAGVALWDAGGTPALLEHLLCSAYNTLASAPLRFLLAAGCAHGFPFSALLRRLATAAAAALRRFGGPGVAFHAPAAASALRVLQHPLASTAGLEAPLSYLFFGGGCASAVAAVLGAWAAEGGPAAAGALPLLVPALRVLAAHCEQPGVALSGGALAAALRTAIALARAAFFHPKRAANPAEYEAFAVVAARAANIPAAPPAWGCFPPHAGALALTAGAGALPPPPPPGDSPAAWAAAAAELMEVMECAVDPEAEEPGEAAAAAPVNAPVA